MQHTSEFNSLLPAAHLDRREFLAAAIAGFALAVQPVSAQSLIVTDTAGLATGSTGLPADGGTLPIYWARPANGSRLPTVLVVQEIFGVHEHIKDVCRRLAKLGYLAIAPELYFRQGNPAAIANIQDILT
ncbi:MAG: dienelactone hydrolase family protein, partial [Zoogloea sp.]|nr:dienelactone hydrolase family protein [Zoogloea sp.]